ncbi:hypothetical protein D3C84_1246580 [compost metagenome]
MQNLAFVHGLKDHHQFSGRTFLMQFQTLQQTQVGFDGVEQFGSGKYDKTGNMQRFVHVLAPIGLEKGY